MKKLLPLSVLLTLVACNGGSSSSKPNFEKIVQNYESNFVVERGMVSLTKTVGTEANIDINNDGTFNLVSKNVNREERNIVIKVEGNKVYKYIESKNLSDGTVSKSLELETNNASSELKEILSTGKGKLEGDTLVMNSSDKSESDESGFHYVSNYSFNVRVNLLKPFCETNGLINENIVANYNGVEKKLSTGQTMQGTCEGKLAASQIKAIDLSKIEFCEEAANDEMDCKEDQDMSFLTSDL